MPSIPNIAHDSEPDSSVCPNPAFWNDAPLKVATNSSARPGAKVALVRAQAPSTVTLPPPTDAVPPVHEPLAQPTGRLEPENSAPTVGARMTSPFPVSETYVEPPVVPAPKSATVVSTKPVVMLPVVNDQVLMAASGLPARSVTAVVTVTA